MKLAFDRDANRRERLRFIREYAEWVKRTPDDVWGTQQATLIDSFIENARNMPLTKEDYLKIVDRRKKKLTCQACS